VPTAETKTATKFEAIDIAVDNDLVIDLLHADNALIDTLSVFVLDFIMFVVVLQVDDISL
jgi:Na+-transporting NADH:ubiquinone oxidoreductase subunit NqrE